MYVYIYNINMCVCVCVCVCIYFHASNVFCLVVLVLVNYILLKVKFQIKEGNKI